MVGVPESRQPNEMKALTYMTALRVLTQVLIVLVLLYRAAFPVQVYVLFLLGLLLFSNFLLWKCWFDPPARRHFWIMIETLCILPLFFLVSDDVYYGFFMVQVVTVCLSFEKSLSRNVYSFVFLILGYAYVVFHHWGSEHLLTRLMIIIFPYLFLYFSGNAIRKLDEQRREMEALNQKLEAYAEKEKHLAIADERNRLAREIHDTVAHRSTGLIMQLQAAKSVLGKQPHKVEKMLDECLRVSRSMLEEMRRSVRALTPYDADNLASRAFLQQLVAEYSSQTGMRIHLQVQGRERQLMAEQQLVLYRAIQEALTNAQRHGKATEVFVSLVYADEDIKLTIFDNGQASEKIAFGFGLKAMRERVEQLKGTFQVGIDDRKHFHIQIEIPLLVLGEKRA